MKATISVLTILLLSCSTVSVYSQQPGSCSTCKCAQFQLNSVEILKGLVQSIVNETLNETFESVQQQIDATIDEKIALNNMEHQDTNTPGEVFTYH